MIDDITPELKASRRHPYQSVDWQHVQTVLGDDVIVSKTLLYGGACNTNYALTMNSGKHYVYRHYARGSPRKDAQAMKLLDDQLPVPTIFEMDNDWALMRFLPGVSLTADSPALVDVGRCLGVFSNIQFEQMGDLTEDGLIEPLPFGGFLGFFNQELKKLETLKCLSLPLLDRLRQFIDNHTAEYQALDAQRSFVHGDFNPGNILVDGDRVVGILDWEYSMSGSPMIDTGNLIRHFGEDTKQVLQRGMLESGMSLNDDWVYLSQLADLASHIEFLSSDHNDKFKQHCVERIIKLLNA